jgi:hypothetical protein
MVFGEWGALACPVIIAAVMVCSSCRQIVGVTELSGDSAPACGLELDGPCGACMEQNCCAEALACSASQSCSALELCVSRCHGDAACRSQCTIDQPVTDKAVVPAALEACIATHCEVECGPSCRAMSKIATADAADSCATCIEGKACNEAASCADSAECQRYLLCRENCVTGECVGSCALPEGDDGTQLCLTTCGEEKCVGSCAVDPTTSGTTRYSAFYRQASLLCRNECQAGGNWACVGHVQWPHAKASVRHFTVALLGFFDGGLPQPGVTVKLCTVMDTDCSSNVSRGITDPNGIVRLTDSTDSINGQHLGLFGYLQLSSPDLYPTTVYWEFPLSEPEGLLSTPILVASAGGWRGLLITLANVTPDPELGHIAVVALDCLGNQAANVRFSARQGIGESAKLLYASDSALSPDGPTDSRGTAFFINVPPGLVEIDATPDATGQVSSHVTALVRPGSLTEVNMAPTPP